MQSTFTQPGLSGDWRNTHYVDRQDWLTSSWPEPPRQTLVQQLRRLLHRLGRRMSILPSDDGPITDQRD